VIGNPGKDVSLQSIKLSNFQAGQSKQYGLCVLEIVYDFGFDRAVLVCSTDEVLAKCL